jgi:hypothetical protein
MFVSYYILTRRSRAHRLLQCAFILANAMERGVEKHPNHLLNAEILQFVINTQKREPWHIATR